MTTDVEQLLAHADWLRALARRLVGPESADDIVQETFAAALRSPPDPERPARPWLAGVLRNMARMRYRSDSRRARREDVVAVAAAVQPTTDAVDVVQRLEVHRALCEAVIALGEPYRTTLVHHYYDGRSLADIARLDAVPEATVRWRHKEALRKLRAKLDERSGGERSAWVASFAPLAAPTAKPVVVVGGLLVKKLVAVFVLVTAAALIVWKVTARESAAVQRAVAPPPGVHVQFGHQTPLDDGTHSAAIRGRVLGARGGTVQVTLFDLAGRDEPLYVAQQTTPAFDFRELRAGTYCVVATTATASGSACDLVVRAGERLQRDVTLTPLGAKLHGLVSDADGGPIGEPLVVAQRTGGGLYTVRGGRDGRYELALAPGWYRVAVSADGYTTARHYLEVSAARQLDVLLNAGSTIAGRVVDEQQRPVHGARVSIDTGYRKATRSAITTTDGRFAIEGLRPGRYAVIAANDERVAAPTDVTLTFGATQEVELVLAASRVALDGRVVDENGRSIANTRIDVRGPLTRTTYSDRDGAFRIAALVAGEYEVAAIADGYVRTQTAKLVPHEGTARVTLRLVHGITLAGVVRTATGQAVAGASVASSAANLHDPRLDVQTDAAGEFRIGPLPPGSVKLAAFHPAHGVSEIARVELPTPRTELVFRSSASVEGTVKLDDGTAARGAIITIETSDAPARWSLVADERGHFELGSLPAGTISVSVEPPIVGSVQAVPGAHKSITLRAGTRERVELTVPGGSEHIRGRIIGADGKPLAGAAVFAERADRVMSPTSLDDVRAYSWTDGSFDIGDLARGTYNVYASHPDHASAKATATAGATGITITLARPASVSGRVVDAAGKPVRSFHVQWSWIARTGGGGEVMTRGARMIEHPNGELVLDGLETTRMLLVGVETADGSTGGAGPFKLAPGQRVDDARIQLVGAGRLRGRLIDRATGKPALGLDVWFIHTSTRESFPVDGNGRFEGALPAGDYDHLNVQNGMQGYPDVERKFTIKPGAVTDLGDVVIDL